MLKLVSLGRRGSYQSNITPTLHEDRICYQLFYSKNNRNMSLKFAVFIGNRFRNTVKSNFDSKQC
jgi:hypothetical protein